MTPWPDIRADQLPARAADEGVTRLVQAAELLVSAVCVAIAAAFLAMPLRAAEAEEMAASKKAPRRYISMQSAPDQDDPMMNRRAREALGRDLTRQEQRAIRHCMTEQPARGVRRGDPHYAAILDTNRNGIACEPSER